MAGTSRGKGGITIRVKFNDCAKLAGELAGEVDTIIDKFLTDVDADATMNAPVRTGHLKNARNREDRRIHWYADYAAYVDQGTRFMAANGFVTNAVERAEPGAQESMAELAGRLSR